MACSKVISDFEVLSADDTGRRRDRSDAEKIRIVEESFRGHRQGSATARRYGLSRSLLTRWRKEYREGLLAGGAPAFMPLQVGSQPASTTSTATEAPAVEYSPCVVEVSDENSWRRYERANPAGVACPRNHGSVKESE